MERIVFGNKPPTVLSHVLKLRWLGTNWRGLAGASDVLRWWISHLNSFENVFTVLVLPRSDGDYSGIHPWCDLTTQSPDKTQNYKICILSLSPSRLHWPGSWFIQQNLNGVSFEYLCPESNKYFLMTRKYLRIINALLHLSMVYEGCKCRFISHNISIVW